VSSNTVIPDAKQPVQIEQHTQIETSAGRERESDSGRQWVLLYDQEKVTSKKTAKTERI